MGPVPPGLPKATHPSGPRLPAPPWSLMGEAPRLPGPGTEQARPTAGFSIIWRLQGQGHTPRVLSAGQVRTRTQGVISSE